MWYGRAATRSRRASRDALDNRKRGHSNLSRSLSSSTTPRSNASDRRLSDTVCQRPSLWPALRKICELARLGHGAALHGTSSPGAGVYAWHLRRSPSACAQLPCRHPERIPADRGVPKVSSLETDFVPLGLRLQQIAGSQRPWTWLAKTRRHNRSDVCSSKRLTHASVPRPRWRGARPCFKPKPTLKVVITSPTMSMRSSADADTHKWLQAGVLLLVILPQRPDGQRAHTLRGSGQGIQAQRSGKPSLKDMRGTGQFRADRGRTSGEERTEIARLIMRMRRHQQL